MQYAASYRVMMINIPLSERWSAELLSFSLMPCYRVVLCAREQERTQ